MPWDRSRPAGSTTNPKYHTPEHRAQVKTYKQQLAREGYLTCSEVLCKYPTRVIVPGIKWAAGHDPTGTYYIGPVHRQCNASDAGRRARQRQTVTARYL